MSKESIGLKLADGEFYPVLEDGVAARKRLVVTTVQDGQKSVQIDLYRGAGARVEGSEYIGSLVIEDIPDMPKGEPDIRMDIGLTEDGTLTAFAQEASTGASQSLKVTLQSLGEHEKYEVPDFKFSGSTPLTEVFEDEEPGGAEGFGEAADIGGMTEMDESEEPEIVRTQEDSAQLLAGVREGSGTDFEDKPRGRIAIIAIIALVVVAALVALGFLLFKPASGADASDTPTATSVQEPEPTAPVEEAQPESAAAEPAAPAPVEEIAAAEPESAAPETAAPEPAEPSDKEGGVNYKIKWGDTLWELSYAYYRNPWYFGKIALANGIKNPDKIIAGRTIWIPPR